MKSIATIAVIGLLLLVGLASASEVTNVEIKYQDGATVARIDVNGPIRFTHETEVPKNGRPDRVIVDILSATHELGAKEFLSLPACLITSVRTSQFAVNPEKIVRVVFDLTSTPLYRLESKDGAIVIVFENKDTREFKTWSSRKVVTSTKPVSKPSLGVKSSSSPQKVSTEAKSTSTAKKNQAIEADRLASLGGKAKAEPTKITEVKKASPTPIKTSDRRFSARTYSDNPYAPPTPKASVSATPKKSAPVAEATKPAIKKSAPVAETPKPTIKKSA
ncbi:MAG: AMIN domain-containing protein, partial [candidate division Zixibacteria bacterium]|nr:AMIN domain-containing protein [candidate division Zixibacteria bacterium]